MRRFAILALAVCCISSPAFAQEPSAELPSPEEASRTFTLAGGVGWIPDYEGSDDYRIIPAVAVRGEVAGVGVISRGTYLYFDLFPRGSGAMDLDVGPVAGVRANRTGDVDDPVVDLLPDRKTAIELGGFAGVSFHNITNPYDSLSFRLDVLSDVANAHESTTFSPSISFSTPLSRYTYASASADLVFVSDKFADYYYGITPADSIATGGALPVFDPDGGLKNWKLGLLVNQSVTGDLTGGLSIFGTANYSRLVGDFKEAPIVRLRGSASQWLLAAGLAYTW